VEGLHAAFQLGGPWSEYGRRCWPKHAQGIAQELPSINAVGSPIGLYEKNGVGSPHRVLLDGLEDVILVIRR
jgi:hypothetical protein